MKLPKLVHLDIEKHEEHKGFTCAVCEAKRMVKLPELVQNDQQLDVRDRMFFHKDVHSHPDQKLFHKDLVPPTRQRFVIKEPDILKEQKRFTDNNTNDQLHIKREDYFAPRQPVLLIKNIKNPIFLRKERRRFQKESCLTQKPLDTLMPNPQRGTGALHARLMSKIQINNQMNTLRSLQNLTPIQTYSNRMIRFKLMQNHRRQTMPFGLQQSPSTNSSSTPTVPYSTADILYNSDVPPSPQLDDSRQNSFLEFSKSRERNNSRELTGDQQGSSRRPSSKSGSRRSYSIEKVSFNKESEDNLRQSSSTLPPTKQGNYYRPNGLRNSILKGEPLFNNSKSNGSGRDTDDLIAMGTIWSPNVQQNQQQQQQQQQIPYKNSSSHTSSANSMTNTILNNGSSSKFLTANSAGGSTSSTAIGQPQLRKNNVINSSGVKSIMVNNAPFSGVKNNLRDRDSKEIDPKYIDPIVGSQASFQQRIMELSALESETIRYEKTKRLKKKVKQDRDS